MIYVSLGFFKEPLAYVYYYYYYYYYNLGLSDFDPHLKVICQSNTHFFSFTVIKEYRMETFLLCPREIEGYYLEFFLYQCSVFFRPPEFFFNYTIFICERKETRIIG